MLPQEFISLFTMALFHIVVPVEAVQRGFGNVNPPVCTKHRSLHPPEGACKGHRWLWSCAKPAARLQAGTVKTCSQGQYVFPWKSKKNERKQKYKHKSRRSVIADFTARDTTTSDKIQPWWATLKYFFWIFLWLSAWSHRPPRISDFSVLLMVLDTHVPYMFLNPTVIIVQIAVQQWQLSYCLGTFPIILIFLGLCLHPSTCLQDS